jgi:hypothetical protein
MEAWVKYTSSLLSNQERIQAGYNVAFGWRKSGIVDTGTDIFISTKTILLA